ncbi:transporter substrate-binding domain-containing protein [Tenuibacillus multivorans]|uniref:Glutamine transport system substrate-binding protein n=1 Tax=Tenuibacillus multivorans TaxID=237069 RepID=A0A1G9WF10_9BACI|nr:transporter substrate-binding domain-containing protein [Tenuibacillus multivorans]GEL76436.1 basic amino acid ABC transporter substrate-binding protein [Tenuibacillus multivorans]SDM83154.1 glutamine transport system substrate-binding protein [Tenuibacillus multivorans]
MKKLFIMLTAMIALGILVACGTSGSDGDNTYTVATDANFQPFEYKNPDTGEMEGFDIELIEAIAEDQGFEVEFETMDFDGLLASMRSGKHDIGIAGISIKEDRKEFIDFSDPYYDSGLILAVPIDSDIESIDDVAGLNVGARQGSTSEDFLLNNTDAEVTAYPEIVTAYMNLERGRLDAVLYDLPNVQYYIKEEASDSLKTVGDVMEGQPYGIALPKDSNPELLESINEGLKTIKENGTYDEIYEKWFGEAPPQ